MSKGRAETAAGAPGILLKYLQEQNRPYSAQDVFGNLQREHGLGKAAVVKALEQLAQQGKIKEKVYGKQKIYFADQDQFAMVSDADLQGLDAKIVALTAKVQSLQQSCRHMEAERDPGVEEGMCWLQRETEEYKSSHQPRDSGRERAGELGGPEQGGARRQLAPTCRGAEGLEAAVVPSRCTARGRSTARSGGSARGWQQSCRMQFWKDTPRARSSSLRKSG
ncbi:homologous-pairing protein 2 homolog isoform X3 [Eumetopias jubatus]|uniref:homologous-pairing protein 2 homolog isoform X3 n=1 Tax=Eumetopias jubatus TaxID=34886 RepID=UPI0010162974|nr:homologous-pairing protein 2 homolog isoform X3 [Eumetopias jubatus]